MLEQSGEFATQTSIKPSFVVVSESKALIPAPPKEISNSKEESKFERERVRKPLSPEDLALEKRAKEELQKAINYIVESKTNPYGKKDEIFDPNQFTEYKAGVSFPQAKLVSSGIKAAKVIKNHLEDSAIEYDRGVIGPDNSEFFNASPYTAAAKELIKEINEEMNKLRHDIRQQVISEIKAENKTKPRSERTRIRGNQEITDEVKKRLFENEEARSVAAKKALYQKLEHLEREERIKEQTKWLQDNDPELTAVSNLKLRNLVCHQNALADELGLRGQYHHFSALDRKKIDQFNTALQSEVAWEKAVQDELAKRVYERLSEKERTTNNIVVDENQRPHFDKKTELQLAQIARKTAFSFRKTGIPIAGGLTKTELKQLREKVYQEKTQKTAELNRTQDVLRTQEWMKRIEERRETAEKSIKSRLVDFITKTGTRPTVVREALKKLWTNKKVQAAVISGLTSLGISAHASPLISPADYQALINTQSNAKIEQSVDVITPSLPETKADYITEAEATAKILDKLEAAANTEILNATSLDLTTLKTVTQEMPEAKVAEKTISRFTLPAAHLSNIKAPSPSYGKEGRLSTNPNALVVPNLQRDNVIGIGDVNEISLMDSLVHDTNTKTIRISTSGMSLNYIEQNWSRTIDKVKTANAKGLEPRLVLVDYNLPTLEEFDIFLNTKFKTLKPEELPKAITFGNELGIRTEEGKPKYFNITHESISDPEKGMPAYIAKLYKAVKEVSAKTGKNIEFTIPSLGWNYWKGPENQGNVEKYIDALQKAGVDIHDPNVTFDIHTYAAIEAPFPFDENGPQRVIDYKNLLIEKYGVKDPKISIGELWFGSDYTQDQLYRIIKYFKDDVGVYSLILLPHQGSF